MPASPVEADRRQALHEVFIRRSSTGAKRGGASGTAGSSGFAETSPEGGRLLDEPAGEILFVFFGRVGEVLAVHGVVGIDGVVHGGLGRRVGYG